MRLREGRYGKPLDSSRNLIGEAFPHVAGRNYCAHTWSRLLCAYARNYAMNDCPAMKPVPDSAHIPDAVPLACTGARLRKLTRRITCFYEAHLRTVGIRLSQYSVLMNISQEPITLLQLADRLEMDRTTLTRSLKPLIDQGWIAEASGGDLRQRLLILTPAGLRFRQRAELVWRDAQLALEAHMGRDVVLDLNTRLERALTQLKPALADDN